MKLWSLNPLKAGQLFRQYQQIYESDKESGLNPLKAGQLFRLDHLNHILLDCFQCLNPLKAGQLFRQISYQPYFLHL